jgi:hypothetical protein
MGSRMAGGRIKSDAGEDWGVVVEEKDRWCLGGGGGK